MRRPCRITTALVFVLAIGGITSAAAADTTAVARKEVRGFGRFSHEFILPIGSVLLPGLGQFGNGEVGKGFAYLGASFGASLIALSNDAPPVADDRLPRTKEQQAEALFLQVAFATGLLSGYDGFASSLPKLQVGGHYTFIDKPTPLGQAFIAPFKFEFLKNKRTWIFLTIPAAIIAAVALDQMGTKTLPFKGHDAAFTAGLSYTAGVTEEAFFRGYVFPVANEMWRQRTWAANATQALLFGLGHYSTDNRFPIVQTLVGAYWGWVVEKDDWDFQQTIFQHFWWNAIIIGGAFILDDGGDVVFTVALPPIRF